MYLLPDLSHLVHDGLGASKRQYLGFRLRSMASGFPGFRVLSRPCPLPTNWHSHSPLSRSSSFSRVEVLQADCQLMVEAGMDVLAESSERTWLEVVKAAANLHGRDTLSRDSGHYPIVVEQSWIQNIKDPKDFRRGKKEDFVGDVLQKVEDGLDTDLKANRLLYEEERELVRDLLEKLEGEGGLTEADFLGLLKPYLLSLKRKTAGNEGNAADEPHSNGAVSNAERRSPSSLLRKVAPSLGPRLVSVIVECCIVLRMWSMVHVLLERRVVDTRDCTRIVESAIEDLQPRTLCHCITYGPDLSPLSVYFILDFFLNNVERPPKSFQIVKGEWKRYALQKIETYRKTKDATSDGGEDPSPATVVALAKAIDGFSAPELCLHHLVASERDESVLSSVVARLGPPQLLCLLQYLCKWVDQYSSHLGRYPTPKIGRIPSLNQVLFWTSVILEGNYTKFVLSSDYHPVVKTMKNSVQPLIELSTRLTALIGIVDHLRYRRYVTATKARVQDPTAPTDYIIELLDLG